MKPRNRAFLAAVVCISTLLSTSAIAQTAGKTYAIEMVVAREKKSFETDADITFDERVVKVVPDKSSLSGETKEFAYADIKLADQSYSKKPLFSVGGGVTTVVLTSLIIPFIAVPFLFIKKKKHWMTIQTEKEYMVLKLGDKNFRQIAAELEIKGVKVSELKEKEK